MEIVALRSAITLLILAVFVGIAIWAWSGRNRGRFDAAAKLPFADEELHDASSLDARARTDKPQAKVPA